jgi:uncharacterized membrane protein
MTMSKNNSTGGLLDRWETIRKTLPALNPVIKGHPLHAIMTDMPAALIPTGFTFSLLGRLTGRRELETAGYLNAMAGVGLAVPTAMLGIADYLQMEVRDPAQKTGFVHGILNAAALTLGVASLAGRSIKRPSSGRGLWLGGLSTALLFASAYLGGDLVYHRGWRVKPMEREEIQRRGVPDTVHEDDFVLRGSARSTAVHLPRA